jgi:hypothetical protein
MARGIIWAVRFEWRGRFQCRWGLSRHSGDLRVSGSE